MFFNMGSVNTPIERVRVSRPRVCFWLDASGIVLFLTGIVYFAFMYNTFPEEVPVHFSMNGEVNEYGNKAAIWLLPAIAFVLWVFMSLLERVPHIHNYPRKIHGGNIHAQYRNSILLLNTTKNYMLVMLIGLNAAFVVNINGSEPPHLLIISLIAGIFAVMLPFLIRAFCLS